MLLLSEGTLFFWNVYHASNENSKDTLVGNVNDWMLEIDPRSREPSIFPQQLTAPPLTSISASTTAVSKSMSINGNPTTAERESIPEKELVGAFGDNNLDNGEERAALGSSNKEIGGVNIYLHCYNHFTDLLQSRLVAISIETPFTDVSTEPVMRPQKRKRPASPVSSSEMSDKPIEPSYIEAWADIGNKGDQAREYDGDQEGETDDAPLSEKGAPGNISNSRTTTQVRRRTCTTHVDG